MMSTTVEWVARAVLIGTGATFLVDIWGVLLGLAGIPTLRMALLGRWVGHLMQGRWHHLRIADATPVPGEGWIGWCAHYGIGITFATWLLLICGLEWARDPSLLPPLVLGVVTVAAPLFILQPGMGAGIASSKAPRPLFNAARSVVTHTIFGLGLYLSARVTAALLPMP